MEREVIVFETDQDLLEILSMIPKSRQPITLESTVERKANKKSRTTGEPYSEVFDDKILSTKKEYVALFCNYEKATKNKLIDKDLDFDSFESAPLAWGSWLEFDFIIEHKEAHYLRYYENQNPNNKYSEYNMHYPNGTALTEALEQRYWNEFGSKSTSKKQLEAGLSDEEQVKPRSVTFSNINRIVADKKIIIRKGYEKDSDDLNKLINWHDSK